VKAPGTPLYSAGKDGDLRDIWRRITGEIPLEKNQKSSGTAKIMTVFGKEGVTENTIADITKEISIIGKHLQEHGAKKVAIYLPNSVEFLAALFTGAFYGYTPILIPYNQPHPTLIELLIRTGADSLIAPAGSIPLDNVSKEVSGLRNVIWTVEKTSRHMDWNEVPEGIGGKIDVSVWHQLVQDQKNGTTELPQTAGKAPNVVFLWQEGVGKSVEIVEFTQQVRNSAFAFSLKSYSPEPRTYPPPLVLSFLPCLELNVSTLLIHCSRQMHSRIRTACALLWQCFSNTVLSSSTL
jgi:acyl-CoA synthetase (AMP-forming)/AMP-acid ligase II